MLQLHEGKIYLQHCNKGFSFLGIYIKPYRCYAGRRMKHNFIRAVSETANLLSVETQNFASLQKIRASLNSYLGILKHCQSYKIRRKVLLGSPHLFFRYGYLDGKLTKYTVYDKYRARVCAAQRQNSPQPTK